MAQKILNIKKIPSYLKGINKHLSFNILKVLKAEELTGGNVSYVYRVSVATDAGSKTLIFKQALDEIKRPESKKHLPKKRVWTEARVLQKLKEIFDEPVIPEVYYLDKKNYVIIMSEVQGQKKSFSKEWEANRLYPQFGGKFGKLFSQLHSKTYLMEEDFSTAQRKMMEEFYIPRHLVWGARKHLPHDRVDSIIKASYDAEPSLVWLDPVHRNIFVNDEGFSLVDFEFCLHLDPAMDLGIFLTHWAIKTQELDLKIQADAWQFIKDFINAYQIEWQKNVPNIQAHLQGIFKRTVDWLGIYMLSRVDGKHGSYVKDKKVEQKVREVGKDLLIDKKSEFYQKIHSILPL